MVIHDWSDEAVHDAPLVVTITDPMDVVASNGSTDGEKVMGARAIPWMTWMVATAVDDLTVMIPLRISPVGFAVTDAVRVCPEVPDAVGINHDESDVAVHEPPLVVTTVDPGLDGSSTRSFDLATRTHGRERSNSTRT